MKKHTKISTIMSLMTALVLVISLLAACGNRSSADNLLEEILERGSIIMVTSPDFAPFIFLDPSQTGQDQVVGSDAALARFIAEQLGVDLVIERMDFAASLAAVQMGRADMFIGGLAWRAEREEIMDLTDVYMLPTYQGIMIPADQYNNLRTPADFAGLTIGAQNASLQQENVISQLPDANLQIVATVSDGIMQLRTGRLDALAMSGAVGDQLARNYPDLIMSSFHFEQSAAMGNVIALPKDSPELLARINEIIALVAQRGLYPQWFTEATLLSDEIAFDE
jgi:polar amino acid transport system substrate-binding protein